METWSLLGLFLLFLGVDVLFCWYFAWPTDRTVSCFVFALRLAFFSFFLSSCLGRNPVFFILIFIQVTLGAKGNDSMTFY